VSADRSATNQPDGRARHSLGKLLLIIRISVKPEIKNILLVTSGKSLAGVAHPGPPEGRFAIATLRRAGIAMDAFVQWTTDRRRTAKSCGPGAAMLALSLAGVFREATVTTSPLTVESAI
jgi:hypothetical protein